MSQEDGMTTKGEKHSSTQNHDDGGIPEHHNDPSVDTGDLHGDDEAPLDFSMWSSKPEQDRDTSCSSSSQDQLKGPNANSLFSGGACENLGRVPGLKAVRISQSGKNEACLPTIHGLYDDRYEYHANNKYVFPFEACRKDSMYLPYFGIPRWLPLPIADHSTIALIAETNEEFDDMNKQQWMTIPLSEFSSQYSSHSSPFSGRESTISLLHERKNRAILERRRKSKEATKRWRAYRRAVKDETILRVAFLKRENLKLRVEEAELKQEKAKLSYMLYTGNI